MKRETDLSPPLVLLLDGHNLIFRSFCSVPRTIVDPEGRPVNGIYGLLATVLRLVRDRKPSHVAVAFDVPEIPTFRHRLFPAYQGQRGLLGGEHSENFAWQVEGAKRVLNHAGLRALVAPGYEADDIIGTLAVIATGSRIPALIVSNDRDLQQLVTPMIRVLLPGKKPVEIDEDGVRERLGVRPTQVVDWKVLAGDSSDNIPGVAGIGDRSAVALLREFGSLEAMFSNLDRMPPRRRFALLRERAKADLFSEVVRIRTDVALGVGLSDLRLEYDGLPEGPGPIMRDLGLRPPERG